MLARGFEVRGANGESASAKITKVDKSMQGKLALALLI
jgi:hypothetical protein